MKQEALRTSRRNRLIIPAIAALGVINAACSAPQTEARDVKPVAYQDIITTYARPGSLVLVQPVAKSMRKAFDNIPKVAPGKDSAGRAEAAPDNVKLGLDKPVRVAAAFSDDASEGSGDTPDLACINFEIPGGTQSIGVTSDVDMPDDFFIFEPIVDGEEGLYRGHLCFDAQTSRNAGSIAVVASSKDAPTR